MNRILLLFILLLAGCSYNIVQQQNGGRTRPQTVSISGSNAGVGAAQGDGGQAVYIGGSTSYGDPPPSTYPEYNGYYGSGWRNGPIGPAYDPRAWNVPNTEVWRFRVYFSSRRVHPK